MTMPDIATLFLASSRQKLFSEWWPRMRSLTESLSPEQLWWRPNDASNSIGNLLLHLTGNVQEWLVDSFNGAPSERDRPAEFSKRAGASAAEIVARMSLTMNEAAQVLGRITEKDLLAVYEIHGDRVNGLEAVYHVVEHFGMHYGQVLYAIKTMQGRGLGF